MLLGVRQSLADDLQPERTPPLAALRLVASQALMAPRVAVAQQQPLEVPVVPRIAAEQ
jgi:hypothetical protein